MEKLNHRMNMEYLLIKYNEIDRLKAILFDNIQLKIFDHLPKERFKDSTSFTLTTKIFKNQDIIESSDSCIDDYKTRLDILKAKKDDPISIRLLNFANV